MIFQISPKLSIARDLSRTYRQTVPQTRPCNSKASITKSVKKCHVSHFPSHCSCWIEAGRSGSQGAECKACLHNHLADDCQLTTMLPTSIIRRRYMRLHGSKNSDKSVWSMVHCHWTASLQQQPTSPLAWFWTYPHAGIYLRPSDIGCQYSRSIYTACFIVWQPRRAADTPTNWRQSLFCCCTASMEQATDGAETAAIDGLASSWSENISVSFC